MADKKTGGLNKVILGTIVFFFLFSYSFEYFWGPRKQVWQKRMVPLLKKLCYWTEFYYYKKRKYPAKMDELKEYFFKRWDEIKLPAGVKLTYHLLDGGKTYYYQIKVEKWTFKLGGKQWKKPEY